MEDHFHQKKIDEILDKLKNKILTVSQNYEMNTILAHYFTDLTSNYYMKH